MIVAGTNNSVVVSRSEEAKRIGIPMAVPVFQVRDLIKNNGVANFSVNFELYRDISRRVMDSMKEELDEVYQYSVDEAFFVFEAESKKDAVALLARLKYIIERNIGVPVSLGAGRTMTIAKYASEREKRKSGVCVLEGEGWRNIMTEVSLSSVWGIGGATAKKMREQNLNTVIDFLNSDPSFISSTFGVQGTRLYSELSEIAVHYPGERAELPKSIMSTRSFLKAISDLSVIEGFLAKHVENVAREMRALKARASIMRVMLGTSRHGDWLLYGGSCDLMLSQPTNDTRILLKEAIKLLETLHKNEVPYKKVGITVSGIVPEDVFQVDLFGGVVSSLKGEELMHSIDQINGKLGDESVLVGRVKAKEGGESLKERSPRYTTNWNELLMVRSY